MTRIKKVLFYSAILLAVVLAVIPVAAPAFAQSEGVVTFYPERDQAAFAVVEIQDGSFTVPQAQPYKEGFEFVVWSDGFAEYKSGNTYNASANIELYAVWKVPIEEYTPEPLFNRAEKIGFWSAMGVLAVIGIFCFYWFGIKERGVRELIDKIFKRNR